MSNDVSQMDAYEEAKTVRALIEHENTLRNHRITWLVTLQGLMFTSVGFAWNKEDAKWLIVVFSILGSLAAFSSWTELRLSTNGFQDIMNWWDKNRPSGYVGPPVIGHRAPATDILQYFRPNRLLPWLFIAGWTSILIYDLLRA